MALPTFFLVGAAKAGTTSVYDYLHQHPAIFMSRVKEPHFFSWEETGWPTWAVKTREDYEALFDEAGSASARGEASTWYLYSKTAPERIHRTVPDARIIALLRNPADRAYSNWSFNVARDFDPIEDFERALEVEKERLHQPGPWHHYYFHAGLYYEQVRRYYEQFGPERVLVLLYEDLRTQPLELMQRVYSFLGVDPSFSPDVGAVHNKTAPPRNKGVQRLLWNRSPLKQALKNVLPASVHMAMGSTLRKVNGRINTKTRPPLSPAVREHLNQAYAQDVERLETLLGRDLKSIWFRTSLRAQE